MNKQVLTLAVIATTSLGWIAQAAAQDPAGGPHGHRRDLPMDHGFGPGGPGGPNGPGGPPLGMIAQHLGLSEEQKTQLKAIHEKQMEATKPLMQTAGESAAAFEKALEADSPDPAALGQAAIAMRNARRQVEAAHQAGFEEIKALLTPEQRAKVEEMEKHRGERGGDHGFGPGGHGRPGAHRPGGRPDGRNHARKPGRPTK